MEIFENLKYINDLNKYSNISFQWDKLKNSTILISGATGLIGSYLIDLLMYRNIKFGDNVKIIALSRNEEKVKDRFREYINSSLFKYYILDITEKIELEDKIDYIIHLASSTHPLQYSLHPIGTILGNFEGTKNLLELGERKEIVNFFLASSVEIYGEINEVIKFKENDFGYIDCNTLRAGYRESKRVAEALCQAYKKEKNIDFVIGRFCRVYGPTLLNSDTKAMSQFIKNAVNNENIVLKSKGDQFFSYLYVGDAVSSIIYLILNGTSGEAYNIADYDSEITLKEAATILSDINNKEVVFDLPSNDEKAGFSTSNVALLNYDKISNLGWSPKTNIKEGLELTVDILRSRN